jgi:response regulator RpfG family c-di-GMP phosphodiesterase
MIVEGERSADSLDDQLMRLFSRNIGIGLETLQMKEGLDEAQREIAYRLGGAVESRSKETANHIRRVAEMSALIGVSWGLSEQEAMILKYASPLHDVGKIGIPDHILNKPGKHTAEEWEIMKTHAHIGYELVYSPDLEILRIGGLIALEHHERWDGRGYPFGKAREEIGIHGRIVAAIDVFDALGSKRCYKNAWPLEHIVDVMRQERGAHFDPTVIDVILDRLDDLTAIREALPD